MNPPNFIRTLGLIKPIYFSIKNTGNVPSHNVKIEIKIQDENNIFKLIHSNEFPDIPQKKYIPYCYGNMPGIESIRKSINSIKIEHFNDHWLIELNIDNILPKDTHWMNEHVYIGSIENTETELNAIIYSSNIANPQKKVLKIIFDVETRSPTFEELEHDFIIPMLSDLNNDDD